jgi:hypothetical protein
MLRQVTAVRFDGRVGSGKTHPCRIACADAEGDEHELIVKFVAGCERKIPGLIAEAVTAILGIDLDLPVPEPFLVKVELDFVGTIPDDEMSALARASLGWNFGSKNCRPDMPHGR